MKTLTLVDKTENNQTQSLQSVNIKPMNAKSMNVAIPMRPINPDGLFPDEPTLEENVLSFQGFIEQKQASLSQYRMVEVNHQTGVRLINSKFPPIDLFADVASPEDFEDLYTIQSITNLRCKNDNGTLNLLAKEKIPHDIIGSQYAVAPFTHINPDGSRFSNGLFGVMYIADCAETAMAEVCYHQLKMWQNIEGLHFDSIVLRQLNVTFSADLLDLTTHKDSALYHRDDYSAARALGSTVYHLGYEGIQFQSVRREGHTCWALMTPQRIEKVVQSHHYELIYDGKTITHVRKITDFEH